MLARLTDSLNPSRSLAAKLILAIITMSLALSLLISIVVGNIAEQQAEEETGTLHAAYAQQLADELDAAINAHQQDIQIFASLIGNISADAKPGLLRQIIADYPEYAWFGFAGVDGKVRATTSSEFERLDVSALTWFKQAKTQPYVGDLQDAQLPLSLNQQSSVGPNGTQVPIQFLAMAAPVKNATGRFIGVFSGYLKWTWLSQIPPKILAPLKLSRTIEPVIATTDGRIVLGPAHLIGGHVDFGGQHSPSNGYTIERWADGHDYLVGFAQGDGEGRFKGLGWTIWVRELTSSAFADANQLRLRLLFFGCGLGFLFAGVGAWLMHRFVQPLNQIAAAAEQIQEAEYVTIPMYPGNDEVARVSRALHGLVTTLEDRVKARTREVIRLSEENKQVVIARERLRMARDLHDTLAHTLVGLLTEIRLLHKMALTLPQTTVLVPELALAEEAAKQGLSEARAAIVSLRNNPVREMGLEAALRRAAHHFEQHTGIATAFETSGVLPLLQDMRAETMYHITEEALHNIERHAHATCVNLRLSAVRHDAIVQTTLCIVDNGVGFDSATSIEGHYGMRGMREQAEVIGATLVVQSKPGRGTHICVTLN